MSEIEKTEDTSSSMEIEIAKRIFDWLDLAIKPPLKETGLLFFDKVRHWRFKNQLKTLEKAKKLFEENGLSPKQIPLKTLFPLLEYSSLEEDESLQDKWANLLANALNPEYKKNIHPMFPEILKQLSPTDAFVLDLFYELNTYSGKASPFLIYTPFYSIQEDTNLDENELKISIANLTRLNLTVIKPRNIEKSKRGLLKSSNKSPEFRMSRQNKAWTITELGIEFVNACTWISTKEESTE